MGNALNPALNLQDTQIEKKKKGYGCLVILLFLYSRGYYVITMVWCKVKPSLWKLLEQNHYLLVLDLGSRGPSTVTLIALL